MKITRDPTMLAVLSCFFALSASSCGGSKQEGAPPTAFPAGYPAPSVSGQIGGRPFIGRSALMPAANVETNRGMVSTLVVYERVLGCADVNGLALPILPGEHVVAIQIQSSWPVFPGSVWTAANRADDKLNLSFAGAEAGGTSAVGEVRFLASTPTDGVATIQASAMNPASAHAGSVQGMIPFHVCPLRR